MTEIHSPLIAAIAGAPDDASCADLLRAGARDLLADPAALPEIATLALAPEETTESEAAQALLSSALDEARMAEENGAPEGAALIDAVAAVLTARDAAAPLDPMQRLRLARIYARAGLVPPPFAVLNAETLPEGSASLDGMPDLGALLEPIFREFGDDIREMHSTLSELLAGLPPELASLLVSMTVARPGATEARLGVYWLLSANPDIRLAAATALLSRAEAGGLPPDLALLLPLLRKWVPKDAARAALDGVIRRQMQRGGAAENSPPATVHRASMSLPDGVGAQSLIVAFQKGSRRGVAMAMLKQGHGVKDAFVIPCASATEQKKMLAGVLEQLESFDVPPARLGAALAHGLGEGVASGLLPAPGMVDIAQIWGPDTLTPVGGDAAAILAGIGAEAALSELSDARRRALIKASGDWPERFAHMDSWFEDTGDLRAAISRARTPSGCETAVWKHLATRRDWWARVFASSAAVLKDGAGEEPDLWLSFAAVAQALLDGQTLKRLPIMGRIVAATLAAYEEMHGEELSPGRGKPVELGALLAQSGINEAYLHGYLTALAIAPVQPLPQDWLGPLLGGIEFPGAGSVDLLLDFMAMQANLTDEEAGDTRVLAARIAGFDAEDGLRDWAAGFDDLVSAVKRCWPARTLAADDKRMLRDIAKIAKGTKDDALRAVLPSWVARRYDLRDES